jgi:hypothetical protein
MHIRKSGCQEHGVPQRNIHQYTWTSPDGKNHNQIDHSLIDMRWHSIVLDVRSFRGADCYIPITINWLQMLRKFWQLVNKQQRHLLWKNLSSGS